MTRRHAAHARIALDDLAEIVGSRIGDGRFGLGDQGFQAFPAERPLDGGDLVFSFILGGEHGLGHAEQGARRCVERLGAIDHIFLVGAIGAAEDSAEHLVEHGERGVGENWPPSRARTRPESPSGAACRNARYAARSTIADFAGDCRVAGAMNALLAIGSDAEFAHGFEPFDDVDEVPLARRFRPFPQPGERRALFVFGDDEQSFQSRDRLWRQAFDEALVRAFAGKSARRQGDLFQGDGGGKQYSPLAQIFDHRGHDDVAAIRSGRLVDRDMQRQRACRRDETGELRDRFEARQDAPGAFHYVARNRRNLLGSHAICSAMNASMSAGGASSTPSSSTGKPEIGEVHGKPEPIGGAPPLTDQRHVLGRERVMAHDRRRVCWRIEQRRARLWR